MTSDVRKHLPHYLVLSAVVMTSLVLLVVFRYSSSMQQLIVLLTCLAYVVWGVAHHQLTGDLTKKIALEYVLIATLVAVLVNAVLLQQ